MIIPLRPSLTICACCNEDKFKGICSTKYFNFVMPYCRLDCSISFGILFRILIPKSGFLHLRLVLIIYY